MTKNGQIVMNDKFFTEFVDIIGKVIMPEDGLCLAERLDQTPTFKNGVFYVASELSPEYSGEWNLANCKPANEVFMCLTTDQCISIKQERSDPKTLDIEAVVDGRTFGLISSLLALGLLWYITNSRKGGNATQYNKVAELLENSIRITTDYFLVGDGRKDITQQEYREIEGMNTVVMEFSRYKYEM